MFLFSTCLAPKSSSFSITRTSASRVASLPSWVCRSFRGLPSSHLGRENWGKPGETGLHFLAQGQKLGEKKHISSGWYEPTFYQILIICSENFRYGKWMKMVIQAASRSAKPSLGRSEKMKCLGTNEAASFTSFPQFRRFVNCSYAGVDPNLQSIR